MQVFTSMALFNILIMPLNLFPWVLNGLLSVQVFTSMALFNILIMPLNLFPWVLNGLLSVQVPVWPCLTSSSCL